MRADSPAGPPQGRGASKNPPNRFEGFVRDPDPEAESPSPLTQFLPDQSKSIIATNESPDVGFEASINPYRGCEHGCIYCYARPTHEYLGFSSGLDFETKILVKERAPELLRQALSSPRWNPRVLAISGVTDPYQPVERRLRITRACLKVLADFRNPVVVITKNFLVTRDIDVLSELARHEGAAVFLSITSLRPELCGAMEPRTSRPRKRLDAIRELSRAGVPVGVNIAPVIPGLTDEEIPAIIDAAVEAGARFAGMGLLRLPFAVKELFETWLGSHLPERREKILNRIRSVRGGRLNDPNFGSRMAGEGIFSEQIAALFDACSKRAGIGGASPRLSTEHFRRASGAQLALF